MIQNLQPEAVKSFFKLLCAIIFKENPKSTNEEETTEITDHQRKKALVQLGDLVKHPAIASDTEWRLDIIKFLFLHSFFEIKKPLEDIQHCVGPSLDASLRNTCRQSFFNSVGLLTFQGANAKVAQQTFLDQLSRLVDYGSALLQHLSPLSPQMASSWQSMLSAVQQLQGHRQERVFTFLFYSLALHLNSDGVASALEELCACSEKSLKQEGEVDPPWEEVTVDLLLSFLSKDCRPLHRIIYFIFPCLCPFLTSSSLQQILDVITPTESNDTLLQSEEEDDDSSESDVELDRKEGTSKELKETKEISDAEVSDSEMFALDAALAAAFKSRQKPQKEMLVHHFRLRCLELVEIYLKQDPSVPNLVACSQALLDLYVFSLGSPAEQPVARKALHIMHQLVTLPKIQLVDEAHLNNMLDVLIGKCLQNQDDKLYFLCRTLIFTCRKIDDAFDKTKNGKTPYYFSKIHFAFEKSMKKNTKFRIDQFIAPLLRSVPDFSWFFLETGKKFAFDSAVRMFRRNQCLNLLLKAINFLKNSKTVTEEQWIKFGRNFFTDATKFLKQVLSGPEAKQNSMDEILSVLHVIENLVKVKCSESLVDKCPELVEILQGMSESQVKTLSKRGNQLRKILVPSLKNKSANEVDDENSAGKKRKAETEMKSPKKLKKNAEKDPNSDEMQEINETQSKETKVGTKSKLGKKKKGMNQNSLPKQSANTKEISSSDEMQEINSGSIETENGKQLKARKNIKSMDHTSSPQKTKKIVEITSPREIQNLKGKEAKLEKKRNQSGSLNTTKVSSSGKTQEIDKIECRNTEAKIEESPKARKNKKSKTPTSSPKKVENIVEISSSDELEEIVENQSQNNGTKMKNESKFKGKKRKSMNQSIKLNIPEEVSSSDEIQETCEIQSKSTETKSSKARKSSKGVDRVSTPIKMKSFEVSSSDEIEEITENQPTNKETKTQKVLKSSKKRNQSSSLVKLNIAEEVSSSDDMQVVYENESGSTERKNLKAGKNRKTMDQVSSPKKVK